MYEIYFLARHTPFWGIPLLVLGVEFGYLFWLRKKKKSAAFCLMLAFLGFSASGYYFWAGGPEKTVNKIKKMHRDNN